MKCRFAGVALLGASLYLLSGCVLVPALEPDEEVVEAYSKDPTLPNAIKVAESLRSEYTAEVKDQIVTERVTAIALIMATAVAADLAIRQVSESEVLGLTLGSAALYTGVNFMVSKPQQYIYAAGSNAVQCALDVVHPLRVAHAKRDRLEELIKEIDGGIRDLESELERFKDRNNDDLRMPEVRRGRALVEEAEGLLPTTKDALVVLDNAGGDLYSSLGRIQKDVMQAISANSPNLQSLMQQLGTSLPTLGSQLTGVAIPAVPPGKPDKPDVKTTADSKAIEKLMNFIKALEADVAEVQIILAAVAAKPSAEQLKTCNVNLQQAGLTMKAAPAAVTVPANSTATVSLSGGVLPYQQASWVGQAPAAAEVELTTETGAGLVSISAKAGAKEGVYVLLLRDSAQGRETVNVTVSKGGGVGKTGTDKTDGTGTESTANTCTPDPALQAVQQKLFDKGIKTVEVDGKTVEFRVDGCPGPRTDAAMRKFLADQLAGGATPAEGTAPASREDLFREVEELLKEEADT